MTHRPSPSFRSRSRSPLAIVALLGAGVAIGLVASSSAARAERASTPSWVEGAMPGAQDDAPGARRAVDDELRALLDARCDTLAEWVQLLEARARDGAVDRATVVEARIELIRAQLAAARTAEERRALHDRRVELLAETERMLVVAFESGRASRDAVLRARADRLGAEIARARATAGRRN